MTTCTIPGCGMRHLARGFCNMHYKQARESGMEVLKRPSVTERFWRQVVKTPTCWLWQGAPTKAGYGLFSVPPAQRLYAHRLSYEWTRGPIPTGLVIDHLCRVTMCVNPDHLEPVTQRINVLRGQSPSAVLALQNRCQRGHEFTPENTRYERGKPRRRHCRACQAEWNRNRRSDLADEQPAVVETLDAARLRRSGS